jgi:hypothetical protein|tara:strand:+ start:4150 stop:5319 length:1170 start_codon:yes stop_codon:yes gene_type:complete
MNNSRLFDTNFKNSVNQIMEKNWVTEGYAAPNKKTYPWQWLWDSSFHALIWNELGKPERAQQELKEIFRPQFDSGCVPHINYVRDPDFHSDLWGRKGGSSITQPPMYGHAISQLSQTGNCPPQEVLSAATAGLSFLFNQRARHESGLVLLCHPWESGADDSSRWDYFCSGGFNVDRWRKEKNQLVQTIEKSKDGSPIRNPDFLVASIGFNALLAFNAFELASVTGDESMLHSAQEIVNAINQRWDDSYLTWIDAGNHESSSGKCRTLDALLPLLVIDKGQISKEVLKVLSSHDAYNAQYGLRGVHQSEPTFDPTKYWRGPVWPQLAYLITYAIARFDTSLAEEIAIQVAEGAYVSGFAEYWHPDTGEGQGAIPQSWAGLSLVSAKRLSN